MTVEAEAWARFAVYFAPPADAPLGRFGAAWLGWDADAGLPVARPVVSGLPRPVEALTERAARYGFHATLKAPFRLADGATASDFIDALEAYAGSTPPVLSPALALQADLGFVALRPCADAPALDVFAGDVVRRFDAFRAPSPAEELAKRRAVGLTAAQDAQLVEWGYPYVFDEFRFHMTLSGKTEAAESAAIAAALAPHVAPHLADPFVLDEIALFGEPAARPEAPADAYGRHFRILRRFRLRG